MSRNLLVAWSLTHRLCSLSQAEYEERIKKYSWREQRDQRGCSIEFTINHHSSLAVDASSWASVGGDASSQATATLEGDSGRRLKLRTPEKFLKDDVIKQPDVDAWIRTQASILRRGHFGFHKFKAPPIWLVTGVQLVTGGDVHMGSSRLKSLHAGVGGDASIPLGLPPGTASAKVEGSIGSETETKNDHGFDDEQVWAAQFMEVSIEYGDTEDPSVQSSEGKLIPETVKVLKLETVPELQAGGMRGPLPSGSNSPTRKIPAPIARIVVEAEDGSQADDVAQEEDPEGIAVDENPYATAMGEVDWKMHEEGLKYLSTAKPQSFH